MLHAVFLDRRVQGNRIVYALLVVDAFIGVEVSTLVGPRLPRSAARVMSSIRRAL